MREARVNDFKRKLVTERAAWKTNLRTLTYDQVPSLGSGVVTFQSPLTIFAGANGAGKSTLARCLAGLLGHSEFFQHLDPRTSSGTIALEGELDGADCSTTIELTDISNSSFEELEGVVYVDCARSALQAQAEIRKFELIDELINGVSPIEFDALHLAAVSRIVCRDYRSVRLYETDLGAPQPFFEVSHGSLNYNSATMGDGEFSALQIWWHFWRARKGSIIILEEPETFLSAACQKALCQYIIASVVQKRLFCIIASHSPGFIENVSSDGLQFLSRSSDGVRILEDKPPPVLMKSIGIKFERIAQAFVEDSAASAFLRHILERFDPSLSRRVGITVSNGDGEVKNDLAKFSALDLNLIGVGVFDGDISDENVPEGSTKLPGNLPIEIIFRQLASADQEQLINLSGKPDIGLILTALEGADHHDWFEEFAKECGLNKGEAFSLLFRLWIRDGDNEAKAIEVVSKLSELVGVP